MAITEQQAWSMSMGDLEKAIEAEAIAAQPPEKPAEIQQLDKSFADFIAAAPDFQKTPENINALVSHMEWTRVPTVDDFTNAHSVALYRQEYKAPEVQPETDPEKMPLNQLRDAAFGSHQPDPAWTMELSELKKISGAS